MSRFSRACGGMAALSSSNVFQTEPAGWYGFQNRGKMKTLLSILFVLFALTSVSRAQTIVSTTCPNCGGIRSTYVDVIPVAQPKAVTYSRTVYRSAPTVRSRRYRPLSRLRPPVYQPLGQTLRWHLENDHGVDTSGMSYSQMLWEHTRKHTPGYPFSRWRN